MVPNQVIGSKTCLLTKLVHLFLALVRCRLASPVPRILKFKIETNLHRHCELGKKGALASRRFLDPPRDPPGVPGPLLGPPGRSWTTPRTFRAFVAAGATIFVLGTYFTTALATRQFLDPPRDPPGVPGPLPGPPRLL